MRQALLTAIAILICAPNLAAAPLSRGKISLHLIAHLTPGAEQVIKAGPPAIKILDLGSDMLRAARMYKSLYPQGRVVLRIYTQKSYPRDADPVASAENYWRTALAPPLDRLSHADRALIDYLEGPNECEAYPAWESPKTAAWFARFWVKLADLMAAAGFRPCVGSIPVGNPPGDPAQVEAKIVAFLPALKEALRLHGCWSYHAYSLKYSTDPAVEKWYFLRYRMLHDIMVRHDPALAALPLIITEAGIDNRGNAQTDGWQARGSAFRFEQWLRWADAQLRKDHYVIAATLFESGDKRGWPSFDTEPINPWLARYLESLKPHAH